MVDITTFLLGQTTRIEDNFPRPAERIALSPGSFLAKLLNQTMSKDGKVESLTIFHQFFPLLLPTRCVVNPFSKLSWRPFLTSVWPPTGVWLCEGWWLHVLLILLLFLLLICVYWTSGLTSDNVAQWWWLRAFHPYSSMCSIGPVQCVKNGCYFKAGCSSCLTNYISVRLVGRKR